MNFDKENLEFMWAFIVVPLGWLWHRISSLFNLHRENEKAIADLKVSLARDYVPREEINHHFDVLYRKLDEGFNRMEVKIEKLADGKQDKADKTRRT